MVDYAIVVALYAFMIYIGIITYWFFRKFDRYERVAIDVIGRVADSHLISPSPVPNISDYPLVKRVRGDKRMRPNQTLKPVENTEDIELTLLIKRIAEKMPTVIQKRVDDILDKWYARLCLELFARCATSRIPKNIV